MRYQHVCIESIGIGLPPHRVSSAEIERRLAPVYDRLRLPEGRLELMSGIRERRFWDPGTRPSAVATAAGAQALEATALDRGRVGCLIFAAVCRDFIEPATANLVHDALGLRPQATIFDLSNACLGVLNGMDLVAGMIESGAIEAGLVVSGECGEALVDATIDDLLRDETLTRKSIKDSVASLTIGSAAAAVLLVHDSLATTGLRLRGGATRCATAHHELCRGTGETGFAAGARPLMKTRSEELLAAGCALAGETWADLLDTLGWSTADVDRVYCHQVGSAHRRAMLDTIGVDLERDSPTFPELGNTGSAALPVALGLGIERGELTPGTRAALLGIGSGINCLMLGIERE